MRFTAMQSYTFHYSDVFSKFPHYYRRINKAINFNIYYGTVSQRTGIEYVNVYATLTIPICNKS